MISVTDSQWLSGLIVAVGGLLTAWITHKLTTRGRLEEVGVTSQDRRLELLLAGLERRASTAEARLSSTEERLATTERTLWDQIRKCMDTEDDLAAEKQRCDALEARVAYLEERERLRLIGEADE